MQNVMQWLCSDQLTIRWNATRILLKLSRNPENREIVNHRLIYLADSDNVYIKNFIMRNIYKTEEISESTRDYVISKCENDPNYVVRMVCADVKNEHQ